MTERDWGKEQATLLKAIDEKRRIYLDLFAQQVAKMKAMTFGRDRGDQEIARRVEDAYKAWRTGGEAPHRFNEEHLRSLGFK